MDGHERGNGGKTEKMNENGKREMVHRYYFTLIIM